MRHQDKPDSQKSAVIAKAIKQIAAQWELTNEELGAIIGISGPSVSRLKSKSKTLHGKEIELSLLLIRVYRSLDAILGGNTINIRNWLTSYNNHLFGIPKNLLLNAEGLVNVVRYLDAMRGKI